MTCSPSNDQSPTAAVQRLSRLARRHCGSDCARARLLARCLPVVACLILLGCSSAKLDRASEPAETSLSEQIGEVFAGRSNEIRITQREVSQEDLAHVEAVDDSLERLNLGQTTFDDDSLRRLAGFKKLVQLRLQAPNASDEGIAHLAKLGELKYLHLIDVPITDAGLQKLQELGKLESLYLDHARVSEAGARTFVEARPEVHFHIDGDHPPGDPHDDHHHADGRR
jgi:hypothetical protein